MRRLSRPITQLKPQYQTVIIGSGYGGSIAASRLSRAGLRVCLLEKGKEFLPGDFPETLTSAMKEMQLHKGGKAYGDKNGLYEFIMGDDISVFKGCGLGGTSLVNANVSIEAEERVFNDPVWPEELRNNMDMLKEGIRRAREMLKPVPYPEGKNSYPVLSKTEAMRKSAEAMNEPFHLVDINVNFEDKVNHVGVEQERCNNCGDCVTGCNAGAKNTTAMNYLPDAVNHGAEIFTGAGVSHLERHGEKWLVYFDLYNTGREKFDAPPMFVMADRVFVCAGSLGSTEILLRSKANGLDLSPMLGKRFTGNGDVLGFGYNNDQRINAIGLGDDAEHDKINDVGPCITSTIEMRYKDKLEEGMTLEEGVAPGPIRSILKSALLPISRLIGKDTDSGFGDFMREKWREIQSLFGGPYKGALLNTSVYLVMAHDSGNGRLELENNALTIRWEDVGREPVFEKVSQKLKEATAALGGTYIKNPTWVKMMGYDLVSVHPLGGCVMGSDAATGVTDHKGQVFKGNSGKETYPGLYVMDGAIIPRPLGTNPLLTISGLAERNCRLILEEMGKKASYEFDTVFSENGEKELKPGVQFTEKMTGFFSLNETEDYDKGYDLGVKESSPFEFTLTIISDDLENFLSHADHLAAMTGTMTAPQLSGKPLTVTYGRFNLFIADPENDQRKKMAYESVLTSAEGNSYYFKGFKEIENDKGFDVWIDTTTLFITIHDGSTKDGKVIGKGKLKIKPTDFMRQLTTMKSLNAHGSDGMKALTSFGRFFAGNVWDTYLKGGLK